MTRFYESGFKIVFVFLVYIKFSYTDIRFDTVFVKDNWKYNVNLTYLKTS